MGKVYYFCLVSETVEIFSYILSLIKAIKHNEDLSEEENTFRDSVIVQLYLKYFFISDDRSTLYFMFVIKKNGM